MSNYFEVIKEDDSRVILDDSCNCLELLQVVPLSTATKHVVSDSYLYYQVPIPTTTADYTFLGIGLNELAGKSFCITLTKTSSGARIEFYDPATGKPNAVARDDVIAAGKLYVFGAGGRLPAEHLTGLEVYDANGKVVYSSAAQHLDILYCGGDEAKTITYTGTTVALPLGSDDYCYIELKNYHYTPPSGIESHLAPHFNITNNSVTIKKQMFNTVYVSDSDEPEHEIVRVEFYAWYTYGYLVGKIV